MPFFGVCRAFLCVGDGSEQYAEQYQNQIDIVPMHCSDRLVLFKVSAAQSK